MRIPPRHRSASGSVSAVSVSSAAALQTVKARHITFSFLLLFFLLSSLRRVASRLFHIEKLEVLRGTLFSPTFHRLAVVYRRDILVAIASESESQARSRQTFVRTRCSLSINPASIIVKSQRGTGIQNPNGESKRDRSSWKICIRQVA